MASGTRIVIVGAGFGGIQTYLDLRRSTRQRNLQITLVNRTNYFLFTPLLHEVATGGLGEHNVVEAVRDIVRHDPASFVRAEVLGTDFNRRIVQTTTGDIPYDILVMATGATTAYYGIPGAEEHGLVLKTLADALLIKNRIIDHFERATQVKDAAERKRLLSFCVVGGGATGVEMVTEISDLFRDTFRKFYDDEIRWKDVSLTLVSADAEVLMPFHPNLRRKAERVLKRQGINVLLKKTVKEVTPEGLVFSDGNTLPAGTVIWAAGVTPATPGMPEDTSCHGKRLKVNEYLQLVGQERVFALGDAACVHGAEGKPVPMLAQAAVQQGKAVAGNILRHLTKRPLRPFVWRMKGQLVSLGRFQAAAQIGPIHLTGPLAWFVWRTVYFFNFHSWSKRVKIGVDWFVNLFFPRDITRA